MAPRRRDLRNRITPEAFHVDPALLDVPLASPGRRLAALMTDRLLAAALAAVATPPDSLGFFQTLWGDIRQGLHDRIAGAVVIRPGASALSTPRPTAHATGV